MKEFINFTNNNNILFEQFLKGNNDNFEEEYDEAFLEQLINQEDLMLIDSEVDNSTLMQQIFDIKANKQQFNIFHTESFIQAHETVRSREIDECNSESDDEIDENINNDEQELELYENKTHIINEMSAISLSPCVIIDIINGELQTCSKNSKKNISQLVGT